MNAGMSSTTIFASTTGGGSAFTASIGGSGTGDSVTLTSIGLAPRPVTSRSSVM